jgi:hypothetical protein
MITEKWLTDVGDKVVKDYIQDDHSSCRSGTWFFYFNIYTFIVLTVFVWSDSVLM